MTLKEFLAVFTVNDPVAGRALNTTTTGGVDSLGDLLTLSDPAGGRAIKITISGGVTKFWTEAQGGTQTTSSWTATGAATDINAAIIPKGNGAFVAAIPDGTTTGGNARGLLAVDFQRVRDNANQVAGGLYSAILAGQFNSINAAGIRSVIVTGSRNNLSTVTTDNFIGAGTANAINHSLNEGFSSILNGANNTLGSGYSVISGGRNNTISGSSNYYQVIAGGQTNSASNGWAAVGGGQSNTASGTHSKVSGGVSNTASGTQSFVGGGTQNLAAFTSDTICGGEQNQLTGSNNSAQRFIGGGTRNRINAEQTSNATICGGNGNTIYFGSQGGFIGGGGQAAFPGGNFLTGTNSAIVGGQENRIGSSSPINYATYCFIGGGFTNTIQAESDYSVISGGANNTINGTIDYAVITGGYQGVASLYAQQVHASGRFSANGDAQAHELIWRRAITGTAQTELFLDGTSVAAILPGTNSVWNGIIDITSICTVVGDGTTVVGHVSATAYKVTIKRIGTTTSLVGGVQEIGITNADASMSTAVFTIDNNDTNESLRIRFTPPSTAGSTTVIRVVATFRGTQIQY